MVPPRGLAHHTLEATLQRGVLLVCLRYSSRVVATHAAQLAAGQGRFSILAASTAPSAAPRPPGCLARR